MSLLRVVIFHQMKPFMAIYAGFSSSKVADIMITNNRISPLVTVSHLEWLPNGRGRRSSKTSTAYYYFKTLFPSPRASFSCHAQRLFPLGQNLTSAGLRMHNNRLVFWACSQLGD